MIDDNLSCCEYSNSMQYNSGAAAASAADSERSWHPGVETRALLPVQVRIFG